jgi:type II secretory ATPase GspE/PulE/Tfp pilus assembly ATPase PilB-like protein/CheY-like chemotaxis protein
VDLARRLSLPRADTLAVDASAVLPEAWRQVAAHCGLDPDALAHEVADGLRLPAAQMERRDAQAMRLIPERIARRFRVVPLRQSDRQIVIATADPTDDEAERGLAFASGRMPVFEVASPDAIAAALDQVYGGAVAAPRPAEDDAIALVRRSSHDEIPDGDDAPVVRLVQLILRNAVAERASDIHFEPGPQGGTVRFRVDGVMRVHMRMPMLAFQRAISRIKVISGLDIADRLRPQDGRTHFASDGVTVDLRVSTVPTRETEKCVIRLLRGGRNDKLADLDLPEHDLRALRQLIGHRHGVVIVTGPTGSGKTTTLYAMIRELDNGETNISTVEDPIEYELPGITQMQVESKRDFTFASALRAILRQDPDVILVGEVRDAETATIALQAAMTGHLVLTTLHTNDASSAVSRLVDIGVERPAISASLRGVLAQRLIRRVCPHCRVPVTAMDAEELRLAGVHGVDPVVRAVGCDRCGGSGYLGRMAVLEVFAMNPALQDLIARGATAPELHRAAMQTGMHSLHQSALARVRAGETTLQEVERVIGEVPEDQATPAPTSPARPAGPAASPPPVALTPPPAGAAGPVRGEAPRILVVDDDAVCRKVAKRLLGEGGYSVIEATSGEEGLAHLELDETIALMVLDLGLPGMQGDAVLREMRASPAMAQVPVIVLTGSPDPDLEVRLMDEGADDYIRKPIEPKRFVTRIKAALRRAAA